MKQILTILTVFALLTGCAAPVAPPASSQESSVEEVSFPTSFPEVSLESSEEPSQASSSSPVTATGKSCAAEAADRIIASIITPGMNDSQRIQAAYEYLVETTWFDEDRPIGLETWRVRPGADTPPDYVETRALSVLLYQLGSCEDYAAALTVLLERMGFEAMYLPGLTTSVYGGFVDHAWTAVKLEGRWYHLDSQLEDNVMRNGQLTYRYFLRSDSAMLADHRWGQNLIDYGVLTAAQEQEITDHYLLPSCPASAPTPAQKALTSTARPRREIVQAEIDREIAAYERQYGPLPPLTLDSVPPVFALDGYEE